MTDYERIVNVANSLYGKQGYVDIPLCGKMTDIPEIVIKNVLTQEGFKESNIKEQFVKEVK